MTDYRIPSTMNLSTDYNASLSEAFGFGTAPHSHHHHPPQPQQSSTSPSAPAPPPPPLFNQETLQQRLQALILGARESWTYAIFWQSSYDCPAGYVLGWGDGYYEGEEDKGRGKSNVNSSAADQEHRKKVLRDLDSMISGSAPSADDAVDEEVTDTEWFFLVSMTQSFVNGVGFPGQAFFNSRPVWVTGAENLASSSCDRARQGQTFGLQTIVYIPLWNGVVELGSTEVVFQSSDLMNKVRVLFNFINMEAGSWPLEQGENDPSSFWISEPSRAVELMQAGSWALDQGENGPSSLWIREPWSAVERKDSANPRSNTNQQTAFNRRLSNEKCSETGSSTNGAKIMAVNSTSVERHARGRKTFNVVGSCLKNATTKSTGEDNLRGPPSDRRLLPEPSYQNNQCPDQTPSIEPAKVFDDAIGRYSFSSMAVNETSHCAGETTINVPVTILKDATVKGTGGKSTRGVGIKRDWAWHYCSTIEGNSNGVICSFCDLEIKGGGITRFKTHIYDGDPCKNVKKCKEVPPEVKVEIEKRMKGGYNKRK